MKIQDPAYLFRQQDGVRLSPMGKRRDDKYLVAVCVIYIRRPFTAPMRWTCRAYVGHG